MIASALTTPPRENFSHKSVTRRVIPALNAKHELVHRNPALRIGEVRRVRRVWFLGASVLLSWGISLYTATHGNVHKVLTTSMVIAMGVGWILPRSSRYLFS